MLTLLNVSSHAKRYLCCSWAWVFRFVSTQTARGKSQVYMATASCSVGLPNNLCKHMYKLFSSQPLSLQLQRNFAVEDTPAQKDMNKYPSSAHYTRDWDKVRYIVKFCVKIKLKHGAVRRTYCALPPFSPNCCSVIPSPAKLTLFYLELTLFVTFVSSVGRRNQRRGEKRKTWRRWSSK